MLSAGIVGESSDAFHFKCCSSEYPRVGTYRYHSLYRAFEITAPQADYFWHLIGKAVAVSARVQQSAVSLLILLLTWVTFVVFMPSTLASLASVFSSSMSRDEYDERYGQSDAKLRRTWQRSWYWADQSELDERTLTKIGEWHTKTAVSEERLNAGHVTFKINQVQRARTITSISPAVLLQHLLESFAGTGLDRHQQFIENVQRYAREYREFVVDMDRGLP